jgi:hypothetical protein
MNQQGFRDCITFIVQDEMDHLGMPLIADCLHGSWREMDPALDKAMSEAYASYKTSLNKLSRLATRLGYIDKEMK